MMQKKVWQKPELVVIVRNKPEEAVLQTCKTSGTNSGSRGRQNNCLYSSYSSWCWTNCNSTVGS